MTFELKATSRAKQGTGASRRLRKAGQLPGIVYGGAADAVHGQRSRRNEIRAAH